MRVGVGQRGTSRGFDAQVGELTFAALQPTFDLAQRMGTAQLAEQHATNWPQLEKPLRVFGLRLL